MSEELYRVVLTGYGTGKGEYYVEDNVATLFKTTQEKARKLLKDAPTTIKENLSVDQANKYKAAIEKTGATCDVENMKYNISELSIK